MCHAAGMDIPDNWTEAITLALAALGAVLGVMNTWQALNANRVRLRVKPAHAISSSGLMFSIEVVNLSAFAVTVSEVGFTIDGNTIKKRRAAIPSPILLDGGSWPRRLETRESTSLYFDTALLAGHGRRLGRAYACTACGEVSYGTSPAAEQLRELAA